MGTWNSEIFGNDTSCDIKEYFYKKYNSGEQISDIVTQIEASFPYNLSDKCNEDRYNIFFALAFCLWETAVLSDEMLGKAIEIVNKKDDIEVLKDLGADNDFLDSREKHLRKFLRKISVKKTNPKKRVKPPQQIEANFKTGDCLAFCYSNEKFGGAVIINSEFYKNKGWLSISMTDIEQNELPDFQTFRNSHIVDFRWEIPYGQANRYIAFDDKTARIQTYCMGYENSTERKVFFKYFEHFFSVVGTFPKFTQCLIDTIGGGFDYFKKLNDFSYDEFDEILKARLSYYKNYKALVSNETLSELEKLLFKNTEKD